MSGYIHIEREFNKNVLVTYKSKEEALKALNNSALIDSLAEEDALEIEIIEASEIKNLADYKTIIAE